MHLDCYGCGCDCDWQSDDDDSDAAAAAAAVAAAVAVAAAALEQVWPAEVGAFGDALTASESETTSL